MNASTNGAKEGNIVVFQSIETSSTGFVDRMKRAIGDQVSLMLAAAKRRSRARNDQQKLERLSARILKDIGLHRSEIHEAVWYTGPTRYVYRR